MVLYCFTERAEDNSLIGQGILEGGLYRYTVHHRIHRYAGQLLLFFQRNPQFVKGVNQFRIHLIHVLVFGLLPGGGIIDNILVINLRNLSGGPIQAFSWSASAGKPSAAIRSAIQVLPSWQK